LSLAEQAKVEQTLATRPSVLEKIREELSRDSEEKNGQAEYSASLLQLRKCIGHEEFCASYCENADATSPSSSDPIEPSKYTEKDWYRCRQKILRSTGFPDSEIIDTDKKTSKKLSLWKGSAATKSGLKRLDEKKDRIARINIILQAHKLKPPQTPDESVKMLERLVLKAMLVEVKLQIACLVTMYNKHRWGWVNGGFGWHGKKICGAVKSRQDIEDSINDRLNEIGNVGDRPQAAGLHRETKRMRKGTVDSDSTKLAILLQALCKPPTGAGSDCLDRVARHIRRRQISRSSVLAKVTSNRDAVSAFFDAQFGPKDECSKIVASDAAPASSTIRRRLSAWKNGMKRSSIVVVAEHWAPRPPPNFLLMCDVEKGEFDGSHRKFLYKTDQKVKEVPPAGSYHHGDFR